MILWCKCSRGVLGAQWSCCISAACLHRACSRTLMSLRLARFPLSASTFVDGPTASPTGYDVNHNACGGGSAHVFGGFFFPSRGGQPRALHVQHQFLIESVSFKIGRKYLFRRPQEDRRMRSLITAALNSVKSVRPRENFQTASFVTKKSIVGQSQLHVPHPIAFVH